MKKTMLTILLCVILLLGITGCGNKNNVEEKENVKKEVTWQEDAKTECVVNAMSSIRKYSNDYNNLFSNWYNALKKCEGNSFTKMILDEAEKIGYNDWKQEEKDVFDVFILTLFSVKNNEVQQDSLNGVKVKEVYWTNNFQYTYQEYGKKYDLETKLLYIIFEDNDLHNSYSYRFYSNYVFGNPIKDEILESLKIGNLKFYFIEKGNGSWDIYNISQPDTTQISFMKIDSDAINNKLDSANKLLEIIENYRDEVYKPLRDKEMKEAAEEKENNSVKKEPAIGMNASQVRNSTWGSPDKINKDTYSWGTSEQWVYNDKGYIYFKNGIVTSISER